MKLTVFNVEHGACALFEFPNGRTAMIDCGHNSTTGWYPGSYLRQWGHTSIDALFVTNYDEDHVSGIVDLRQQLSVRSLIRNKSVSAADIRKLKTEDGMGKGIDYLVGMIENYTGTITYDALGFEGVRFHVFNNPFPVFDDENNLSLLIIVEIGGYSFAFTGDLEEAGWRELLKKEEVRNLLRGVDVFFASHHGRQSGCCAEVFEYCTPTFIVISDKAKGFQTQNTTGWYQRQAVGGLFDGEVRWVLTTRSDGDIRFEITPHGLIAYPYSLPTRTAIKIARV